MANYLRNKPFVAMPRETALGAQAYYLENAAVSEFQPMNVNFGIFAELPEKYFKKERKDRYSSRAIKTIESMVEAHLFD